MRSPRVWAGAALALVAAAALAGGALWLRQEWRGPERELVFAVPPGTQARQASGEEVRVFPDTIAIELAGKDTLVIRNDDAAAIQVGPYRIEPGQRFTQRFYSRGTYELLCSVHGGRQIRIVVR